MGGIFLSRWFSFGDLHEVGSDKRLPSRLGWFARKEPSWLLIELYADTLPRSRKGKGRVLCDLPDELAPLSSSKFRVRFSYRQSQMVRDRLPGMSVSAGICRIRVSMD